MARQLRRRVQITYFTQANDTVDYQLLILYYSNARNVVPSRSCYIPSSPTDLRRQKRAVVGERLQTNHHRAGPVVKINHQDRLHDSVLGDHRRPILPARAHLGLPRRIDAPLRVPFAVQHLPRIREPFAGGPARTVVRHRVQVVPVRGHNNVDVQVGHHTGRYRAPARDIVHTPCGRSEGGENRASGILCARPRASGGSKLQALQDVEWLAGTLRDC
ncbi:hypothetical protein BJV78DRAFT_888653 [Lactifluus subvellereus]|nr:hypothetical protein BJV78DRAFT_888653 [Lactifluus subvellereus]